METNTYSAYTVREHDWQPTDTDGHSVQCSLCGLTNNVSLDEWDKIIQSECLGIDNTNNDRNWFTPEQVAKIIEREGKVEIVFENGFELNSETATVLLDYFGEYTFIESSLLENALLGREVSITRHMQNNDRFEMNFVKNLILANDWKFIVLGDRKNPNQDNYRVLIYNKTYAGDEE
jgi:hypothetical protein